MQEAGLSESNAPDTTQTQTEAKPELKPEEKATLLQFVVQLDMIAMAFTPKAPDRVIKAANEFQAALKQWAGVE